MEAVVLRSGNDISIKIPEAFSQKYHIDDKMIFDIFAEEETIVLKPHNKSMRLELAEKFKAIDLNEFETYKEETLSPLMNIQSVGMESFDED